MRGFRQRWVGREHADLVGQQFPEEGLVVLYFVEAPQLRVSSSLLFGQIFSDKLERLSLSCSLRPRIKRSVATLKLLLRSELLQQS